MVWKKIPTSNIQFDEKELACLIYNMYVRMFQDESWAKRFSESPSQLFRNQYARYSRAGLAVILRLIRDSNCVEWAEFIPLLGNKILDDRQLNMGAHYIQELYLHLHMFGLRTEDTYKPDMDGIRENLRDSPLKHWKTIPSAVCLTLVVPHHKLAFFKKTSPMKTGTPACHITLQSYDGRQNVFPDVQMGFGDIRPKGVKNSDGFTLMVETDRQEWQGTKSLIVSTMISTWIVLYQNDLSTEVIFALKSTPTSMLLAGTLGIFLEIHKSMLSRNDVFLSKSPPNLQNYVTVPKTIEYSSAGSNPVQHNLNVTGPSHSSEGNVSFRVSIDSKVARISTLTIHVDFATIDGTLLHPGTAVDVKQPTPFQIELNVGCGKVHQVIQCPVPLMMSGSKTRIARTSCFVEFIAAIASPAALLNCPDSTFTVFFQEGIPILESLPYLNLDCLPILDVSKGRKLGWMTTHLSSMFSARERSKLERVQRSNTICEDAQVNFKDSLLSLFSHVAGIDGAIQHTVFGITSRIDGNIHLLIFISSIRLDLPSQSVVIDAAILPITAPLTDFLAKFVADLQSRGIVSIFVDDAELVLWKHAIPAFVERCRVWNHAPSCQYRTEPSSMPLSTTIGEQFLCPCGMGKFPATFKPKVSLWDSVARFCLRAAITPCFPVPFVDESVDLRALLTENLFREAAQSVSGLEIGNKGCLTCRKLAASNGEPLLKCSRCKVARYCSRECQKKGWIEGGHKRICGLTEG